MHIGESPPAFYQYFLAVIDVSPRRPGYGIYGILIRLIYDADDNNPLFISRDDGF